MKRDWNQRADRLASESLQQKKGRYVAIEEDQENLTNLNRLDELITAGNTEEVIKMTAITRSASRRRQLTEMLQEEVVQRIRIERIKQAQDEEMWIHSIKLYLAEKLTTLCEVEMKMTALIAPDYIVDQDELLFFCPRSTPVDDRTGMMQLLIPELLQRDFLHRFHTSIEGGHLGIVRTYQRI